MKGNGRKRFNGVVSGFGMCVLLPAVAMVSGVVPAAVAAEPLMVAALFNHLSLVYIAFALVSRNAKAPAALLVPFRKEERGCTI